MNIINKIPMFQHIASATIIEDGWSGDEKWKVIDYNQDVFLVRFSSIKQISQKQVEYDCVNKINQHTNSVSNVVTFGQIEDNQVCYIVYRFIEGIELIKVIHLLSTEEQYDLGLQAGKILRQIHQEKGPYCVDPYFQMSEKIKRKKELYTSSGFVEEHHKRIVNYLDEHVTLLKSRPSTFCHGDFHVGNMLYGPDKQLYVIDFNRSAIEDPYQDFNRMLTFGVKHSKHFVKGQIMGYFNQEKIDPTFFPIVLFYACMDIGFGLLWAAQFGEDEIKVHNELVNQILTDFSNLETYIPTWWEDK